MSDNTLAGAARDAAADHPHGRFHVSVPASGDAADAVLEFRRVGDRVEIWHERTPLGALDRDVVRTWMGHPVCALRAGAVVLMITTEHPGTVILRLPGGATWALTPIEMERLRALLQVRTPTRTARLFGGLADGWFVEVVAGSPTLFVTTAFGRPDVMYGDFTLEAADLVVRAGRRSWGVYVLVEGLGPDEKGRLAYLFTAAVPEDVGARGLPAAIRFGAAGELDAYLMELVRADPPTPAANARYWAHIDELVEKSRASPPTPSRRDLSGGHVCEDCPP